MPTYEYECNDCGHRFEEFQSITAEPLKNCPKCNKSVRRLIGNGAGIIFKGSGFYETDYRSKEYKDKAKSESTASGTSSSSSSGSSTSSTSSSDKKGD